MNVRVTFCYADYDGCAAEQDTLDFDAAAYIGLATYDKRQLIEKAEIAKGNFWCADWTVQILEETIL